MNPRKLRRAIIILLVFLVVFFICYSFFLRPYGEPANYLRLAYDYTGRDPHIINPDEPAVEFIWRDGKLLVHLSYHTDQDDTLGPYSLYIDPIKLEVVDEDPRGQ